MSRRLLPWVQLKHVRAELDRLVELLQERRESPVEWEPAVDVLQVDDVVLVHVELPGVDATDLGLELVGRRLLVRGVKRRGPHEPAPQRFHLMERFMGAFVAEVALEDPVDPHRAGARLENGILTVRLPLLVDRRNSAFDIPVEEEPNDE